MYIRALKSEDDYFLTCLKLQSVLLMIQTVNRLVKVQSFPTPFSNPSYLWGVFTDIAIC